MQEERNAHCSGPPLQNQEGEKINAGSVDLVLTSYIIFAAVAGMPVEAPTEVIPPHKVVYGKEAEFFSTQVLSPILLRNLFAQLQVVPPAGLWASNFHCRRDQRVTLWLGPIRNRRSSMNLVSKIWCLIKPTKLSGSIYIGLSQQKKVKWAPASQASFTATVGASVIKDPRGHTAGFLHERLPPATSKTAQTIK